MKSLWKFICRYWEWTTVLFFAPFVSSAILVQFFITREMATKLVSRLQEKLADDAEFAPYILTYISFSALYILVCASILIYFCIRVRTVLHPKNISITKPNISIAMPAIFCGFLAVLLPLVHVCYRHCFQLSQITLSPIELYKHSTIIVCSTMTAEYLVDCISRGSLLALMPWLAGTITGTCGALHAAVVTKCGIRENLKAEEVVDELLKGMMVLSVVLIASVLLVHQYMHMHSNLYVECAQSYEVYDRFAHRVAMFWGVTLTATVMTVYVPQLLRLRSMGSIQGRPSNQNWGKSNMRKKIWIVLSMLGPSVVTVLIELVER